MSSSTNSIKTYGNKWELSNLGGISVEDLNAVEYDHENPGSMDPGLLEAVKVCPPLTYGKSSSPDFYCEREASTTTTRPLSSQEVHMDVNQTIRQSIIELQEANKNVVNELRRLKAKFIMAETKIEDNLDYIYFLEREVARLDQYGRRENIEIIGIPNNIKGSELEINVIRILRKIGLTHIQHFNIAACHRLGSKDRFGNYNTIVRFINRKDSISCLKSRKNLPFCRELGFHHIYITENLCPSNRSIFETLSDLKKKVKSKGYGHIMELFSLNSLMTLTKILRKFYMNVT